MTKDEALKLARTALGVQLDALLGKAGHLRNDDRRRYAENGIKAIDEALAQPEPWEKFCDSNCVWTDHHPDCKMAQPEQKPVAWKLVPRDATDEMLKAMDECSTEGYDERLYAGHAASVFMAAVDAAPAPPQRTWVHLTNEEHTELAIECGCLGADWVFYGAVVERKVREKNT